MQWRDDSDLLHLIRTTLYTPVVGDVLDGLGYFRQFLPQPIQPMREQMVLAGRAMPVLNKSVDGPQHLPFGRLTEALDQLQPDEVYVATGAWNCASWGEIMTATAKTRGAAGAVIDGFHRDTPRILEQNWPVFSRGRYAQDAAVRSIVADFRCAIHIDQVHIRPGDILFGDLDGVVIIPKEAEEEVIKRALGKASGEKRARSEIEAGASSTSVFRKYGIL